MSEKNILNRFKSLMKEYAFIDNDEMNHVNEYLDDEMVYEDGQEDDEINFDSFEDENPDDSMTNSEPQSDDSMPMDGGDDPNAMGDEPIEEPAVEPQPELENPMGGEVEQDGGEIELDVTALVNKTDDAARKAEETNSKLDDLLGQIDQVLQTSVKIDQLSSHIDSLESEIIKRNPSKVEKLELQSLHSAPYNVKLGDFWDDKLGDYATDISTDRPTFDDLERNNNTVEPNIGIGAVTQNEPKEIVVTQKDVNADYNESSVKNSFDDYEEEEIDEY